MSSEIAEATAPSPVHTPARRHSLSVVLSALLVGALAGFVAARTRSAPAPVEAAAPAPAPLSLEDWLAQAAALAANPDAQDPALQDELVRTLAARPGMRAPVLESYGREPDRHRRAVLRTLLLSAPGEDLAGVGCAMAESADGMRRAAGFELLANLPPSEASFALARRHLFDEPDAEALGGAAPSAWR